MSASWREHVPAAVGVAAVCYGFNGLVQLENYLLYASKGVGSVGGHMAFLMAFPFLQLEALAVAALLGAAYLLFYRRALTRWVYLGILSSLFLVIQIDQLTYQTFQQHMSLGMTEGGLGQLMPTLRRNWDSAVAEMGAVVWLNLALFSGALWALRRVMSRWRHLPSALVGVTRRRFLTWGAGYAFVSVSVTLAAETHQLHRHPLTGLFAREGTADVQRPEDIVLGDELFRLRFGNYDADVGEDRGMIEAGDAIQRRASLPNVLVIVVESVGSFGLLPEGRIDRELTPFLAEIADQSIIFTDVQGFYPGTTRSHVPQMTGGRTLTWGSVNLELAHPYVGPTLTGELGKAGYRTGLFAATDLRFGALDAFYEALPWDTFTFYMDGDEGPLQAEEAVHAWGVNEHHLTDVAMGWIDGDMTEERPFFLHFQTTTTHHPYGVREGHVGPYEGDERLPRYRNSLHYNDAAFRYLFESLEQRGLLENTLVVITGDHGQAFGVRHANNLTHRNYLYEENVRNFIIVADPSVKAGPHYSARLADHGDLMPSVLSLVGLPIPDDVLGQDLFSVMYEPKIAYFHKGARPEQWGLKDGQWKYIGRLVTQDEEELYDLSEDPAEQVNLASLYPERVALYRELATSWYLQTNYDYIDRLDGFAPEDWSGATRQNLAAPGPRRMAFGHFNGEDGEDFLATPVMHPNQGWRIWNVWHARGEDLEIRFQVVTPSRQVRWFDFTIEQEWDVSWFNPGFQTAKEEGLWRVSIWQDRRKLIEGTFRVSDTVAPAIARGSRSPS